MCRNIRLKYTRCSIECAPTDADGKDRDGARRKKVKMTKGAHKIAQEIKKVL